MRFVGWGRVECKHQPWLLFCPLLSWRQAGAGGGRRRFPALCRSLAAHPQLQAPVPPICPHDTGWGRSWCQHLCTHHQPQISSCALPSPTVCLPHQSVHLTLPQCKLAEVLDYQSFISFKTIVVSNNSTHIVVSCYKKSCCCMSVENKN